MLSDCFAHSKKELNFKINFKFKLISKLKEWTKFQELLMPF